MSSTVPASDRKPEATIRKDRAASQKELALIGEVTPPHLACGTFVSLSSWEGTLRYAVQRSGHDDYEVADELAISHGYMSRLMRGTANLNGDKLVKLMRVTNSLAPLQWLAEQMGYELKRREPSERDQLLARLAQIDAEARRAA